MVRKPIFCAVSEVEDQAKNFPSQCLPAGGPTSEAVPLVCDVTVGETTAKTSFICCRL